MWGGDTDPDPLPDAALTLTRTGLGSGSGFWAIEAQYAGTLTSIDSFKFVNDGEWGNGTKDTAPSIDTAGVQFVLLEHPEDPALRRIELTAFTATIPAFVHSATSPDSTGDNILTLDPDYLRYGTVDTVTGEFSIRVHALLQNTHYTAEDTIATVLNIDGTIDESSGTALMTIGGFTFDDGTWLDDPD